MSYRKALPEVHFARNSYEKQELQLGETTGWKSNQAMQFIDNIGKIYTKKLIHLEIKIPVHKMKSRCQNKPTRDIY